MILILKDADFSAINIGTVTLPITNVYATQMMSHLSVSPVESIKKWAFASLIQKIEDAGLISNLALVSAPIVSSNLDDAMLNLVNGSNSSYVATRHKRYRLGKYGVYVDDYGNNAATEGSTTVISARLGLTQATIATSLIQKNTNKRFAMALGNLTLTSYVVVSDNAGAIFNPLTVKDGTNSVIVGTDSSTVSSSDQFIIMSNGRQYSLTLPTTSIDKTFSIEYLYYAGWQTLSQDQYSYSIGMIPVILIFDKGLSAQEATAVNNAIKDFNSMIYEDDIDNLI